MYFFYIYITTIIITQVKGIKQIGKMAVKKYWLNWQYIYIQKGVQHV